MKKNKKLAEQQQRFVKSIISGEFDSKFVELIKHSDKLPPQLAMGTYRNDYTARLTEALGDSYEGVWSVLGDEEFFNLAEEYLSRFTSQSYNLENLGEEIPVMLAEHPMTEDFPFLPELAQFEWEFQNILHMPLETPLEEKDFQAATDLENQRLVLTKAIFLRTSNYSIYEIWSQRMAKNRREDIDWEQPENLVLFKGPHGIRSKTLAPEQIYTLRCIREGHTLNQSIEIAGKQFPEMTPDHISELFQFLVADGLITHILDN